MLMEQIFKSSISKLASLRAMGTVGCHKCHRQQMQKSDLLWRRRGWKGLRKSTCGAQTVIFYSLKVISEQNLVKKQCPLLLKHIAQFLYFVMISPFLELYNKGVTGEVNVKVLRQATWLIVCQISTQVTTSSQVTQSAPVMHQKMEIIQYS